MRSSLVTLHRVVESVVRERSDGIDRGDVMPMLLSARDAATGEALSADRVADEARSSLAPKRASILETIVSI